MSDHLFSDLRTVAVPVSDLDRAKALYRDLGFEERMDAELAEGFRWIEVAPPGAATSVALVQGGEGLPTGIDTGIRLVTDDARRAHAAVTALGLDAGELLDWPTAPLMFSFTDLDGNRLYAAEPS